MPQTTIEWNSRGAGWFGKFTDRFGDECSIRSDRIENGEPFVLLSHRGDAMALTREMAGDLAHILLKFAYTGEAP